MEVAEHWQVFQVGTVIGRQSVVVGVAGKLSVTSSVISQSAPRGES